MAERPGWDEYFLDICTAVAQRATCPVRKVGAVLIDSKTKSIKATGYNGSPRNMDHCPDHESGSPLCKALHAEKNILINCAMNGVSTRDGWLYLSCNPCMNCAPDILNAGITRVVCGEYYRTTDGIFYLMNAGVDIEVLSFQRLGADHLWE